MKKKYPLFTALSWCLFAAIPSFAQEDEIDVIRTRLDGNQAGYSSPVVAEIDGDSSNGKEIAIGTSDGQLHVYRMSGDLVWTALLPNYACGGVPDTDKLWSSPAVGELVAGQGPSVVIGYGGFKGKSCDGGVAAYHGSDGKQLWNFSTRKVVPSENLLGVFSTPAIGKIDRSGNAPVGIGSFARIIALLNGNNGSLRWHYQAADTVWASGAYINDGTSRARYVTGSDISANGALRPPTHDGGYVYSFLTKQQKDTFIPFRSTKGNVIQWKTAINQVVFSAALVADVVPSKRGKEIVIGTGCYFPTGTSSKRGREFAVIEAKGGKVLKKLKVPSCAPSAAAAGDLDGDGDLEVIVSTHGSEDSNAGGESFLSAFDAGSGNLLWRTTIPAIFPFQSPLAVDLDNDGKAEVIMASANSVGIYDGSAGDVLYRLSPGGTTQSTPAIDDVDNDGDLDLVLANKNLVVFDGVSNLFSTAAGERVVHQGLPEKSCAQWRCSPSKSGAP